MTTLTPGQTLITDDDFAALRPGDVVAVADDRWGGVTITGPLTWQGSSKALYLVLPIEYIGITVRPPTGAINVEADHRIFTFVSPAPPPSGPAPNRTKLIELLAWATAEDVKRRHGLGSEWDQAVYIDRGDQRGRPSCDTVCCVAGKTVLDAGYTWQIENHSMVVSPTGKQVFIVQQAAELLGLNEDQSDSLFDIDNTLDDLRRIILHDILHEEPS